MSNGELAIGLKLEAKNPTEQRVLDYLRANASEILIEKINAGDKTIKGAMSYCKEEARKLGAEGGCVVVDDETVFGWVIHFFEEDELKEPKKPEPRVAGKAVVHKAKGPRSAETLQKAALKRFEAAPEGSDEEDSDEVEDDESPTYKEPLAPQKPKPKKSVFQSLFTEFAEPDPF